MKTHSFIFAAAAGLLLLCGCSSVNWSLPQAFDYNHRMDTILIQIKDPEVSPIIVNVQQGAGAQAILVPVQLSIDSAVKQKLKTFLYDQFASSARFRVLTGLKGEHAGSENKVLQISPVLEYLRHPFPEANIYYCQTSISCRLLDLQEGTFSGNGADIIGAHGFCPDPIRVPVIYGREHFDIRPMDINTMFSASFPVVWKKLEKEIAKKFPANAKIAKVATNGNRTKLFFPGGTANGFRRDYEFKVYAVEDGIVTVVALASGQIGKNHSTLTVDKWNMDDPAVKEKYYPQMVKNQADNLYVVAAPRD